MTHSPEFAPGGEIEISHPFILEDFEGLDAGGPFKRKSWRPGIRVEHLPPEGEADEVADGIGTQIITVVSIHKPGRFPTRVFFTRRWRDPAGREFGKSKLFSAVIWAFRSRVRGYRIPYRVAPPILANQENPARSRTDTGG